MKGEWHCEVEAHRTKQLTAKRFYSGNRQKQRCEELRGRHASFSGAGQFIFCKNQAAPYHKHHGSPQPRRRYLSPSREGFHECGGTREPEPGHGKKSAHRGGRSADATSAAGRRPRTREDPAGGGVCTAVRPRSSAQRGVLGSRISGAPPCLGWIGFIVIDRRVLQESWNQEIPQSVIGGAMASFNVEM